MSSLNDYIKFTLDIEDQNINGKIYKIYLAELIQPACPYCRSTNLKHNGHYVSNVRFITADASKPVTIRLRKQRVLCNDCLKRSMSQSNLVNKYYHISNVSKPKVLSALTEGRSMTSIARAHNLSVNTVQRVLTSCSAKFYDDFDRFLAFGEFKGVGKKLHFICLDGDTHKVVQILRTRFKPDILRYFYKFTPKARSMVKTVTMDLNCYYPLVARELFPNAQIVIDRFHMVQMLTRSFNSLRVQIMKQFKKQSLEYKLLKSPWKLYLMKYDKLNKTTPYYDWLFKDYLTQEHVVLDGLECNKTLENTYWIMQDFMTAIQNKDEKQIIHFHLLNSKQTVGKQMHQTLLTFKHNYTGVLNGISSNYSNGCLEGINRKIKQIERTACGYNNFSHLLIRIRLEENIVKEKEPNNYFLVA
ncbi:ISL3 family transposase [Lactobacillus johnsonii]|uniref:ISL3 family transposase n=1 Tax=Lactobacillus johnsonii TaxID=33959 RepID=UPI003D770758